MKSKILPIVAIICLFTFTGMAQIQFEVPFNITNGITELACTIGVHPDGSDNEIPPPPPHPILKLYVAIMVPPDTGMYIKKFLDDELAVKVFQVLNIPGEGQNTITISWDIDDLSPLFSFILNDNTDGGAPIDMKEVNNHTYTPKTVGIDTYPATITLIPIGIESNIKIFLQGPYVSPSMTTTLNSSGLLPLEHPYSGPPWKYNGNEAVGAIFFTANPDIVDWVLLELRTGTGSETVAGRRAAFIKSNGSVVDISGTGGVIFGDLAWGDYYMVVYHRNHLAIMSSSAVPLDAESTLYDFTTGQDKTYGTNPMAALVGGVFGLYAGDANKDGQVKYLGAGNDRAVILNIVGSTTAANIISGVYSNADVNMDGNIKYLGAGNDRSVVLNVIGAANAANVVISQVP